MRCVAWSRQNGVKCLIILTCFTLSCWLIKHLVRSIWPDLKGRKVILFWSKYFGGRYPHIKEGLTRCPNQACYVTDDRDYLSDASALIFHAWDWDLDAHDLPPIRSAHQAYVFYSLESPESGHAENTRHPIWRYFFNRTWTYRLDSDVLDLQYFSDWEEEKWENNSNARAFLGTKNNRAVALISKCISHGNREVLIKELGKYFPVDVYGSCGEVKCPRWSPECEKPLIEKYSFYLAFENSHCKDYLTEKILRGYNYGAVPVVYGGGIHNYAEFFPENSYINVDDFATPKDLAEFLQSLTLSPERYERLHKWRFEEKDGRHRVFKDTSWGICRLCELLHEPHFNLTSRVVDLHQWWIVDGNCTTFNGTLRN